MVTIFLGKGLGPDVEMGVGRELRSSILSMVQPEENILHAYSHPRQHNQVGEGLPQVGRNQDTVTATTTILDLPVLKLHLPKGDCYIPLSSSSRDKTMAYN
jgi:hypothetical protein